MLIPALRTVTSTVWRHKWPILAVLGPLAVAAAILLFCWLLPDVTPKRDFIYFEF